MEIKGNHWTVRMYKEYVRLGGFGRDPENLCRFLRVVTIWAPLRWLIWPHTKNGPPFIIIWGFLLLMSSIVLFAFGSAAVDAHDTYIKYGMAGFMPSAEGLYFFSGLFVLIAVIVATAAIYSGLYKLYKEKYKHARSGKFCPYINFYYPGEVITPIPPDMLPPSKTRTKPAAKRRKR